MDHAVLDLHPDATERISAALAVCGVEHTLKTAPKLVAWDAGNRHRLDGIDRGPLGRGCRRKPPAAASGPYDGLAVLGVDFQLIARTGPREGLQTGIGQQDRVAVVRDRHADP